MKRFLVDVSVFVAIQVVVGIGWQAYQRRQDDNYLGASADKERLLGQRGAVIWLYGLSGSGKSTLATGLEHRLARAGRLTELLDGDNVRTGLNKNLGFSDVDRDPSSFRDLPVAEDGDASSEADVPRSSSPVRTPFLPLLHAVSTTVSGTAGRASSSWTES